MWSKCHSGDNTVNGVMSLFSQSLRSDAAKLMSTVCLIRVTVGGGRDAAHAGQAVKTSDKPTSEQRPT